jgi:ATP-dependent DNA ligase
MSRMSGGASSHHPTKRTDNSAAAEIEYRGWTDDAKLPHASFKGFRDNADETRVFNLKASAAADNVLVFAG